MPHLENETGLEGLQVPEPKNEPAQAVPNETDVSIAARILEQERAERVRDIHAEADAREAARVATQAQNAQLVPVELSAAAEASAEEQAAMVARANIRVSSDPNAVLPTKEELLARTKADKEAARIDARERQKEEFIEKVLAARRPEVKPIVKQPVAPAISEQTAREMAAGAKRSAEFAAAETSRPQRKPDPTQGTTTSVFRPVDGSGVQDRKPSHTWGRRTY